MSIEILGNADDSINVRVRTPSGKELTLGFLKCGPGHFCEDAGTDANAQCCRCRKLSSNRYCEVCQSPRGDA
jgi:hypothetical protein